jgi:hypothetical protein
MQELRLLMWTMLTALHAEETLPGAYSVPSLAGTVYCVPTHFFLQHDGGSKQLGCKCTR